MKNWVFLVGMFMLSVSIIIFGVLLSQAIEQTGSNLGGTLSFIAEILNSTLISIAETTGQYKQRYFEKRVR